MWKALKDEVKNGITKTFFHLIRFGGLLLMPFVYGFSYIYAFYDPFEKMDQVKITVVTERNDALGNALAEELSKDQHIELGDIKMTMKMEHVYSDAVDIAKVKKNSYATLQFKNPITGVKTISSQIDKLIRDTIIKGNSPLTALDIFKIVGVAKGKSLKNIMEFTLNNKKNYLLAFGVETGSGMFNSIEFINRVLLKSIINPTYKAHLSSQLSGQELADFNSHWLNFETGIKKTLKDDLNNAKYVEMDSVMGEHAKYGYGLAPFFLSVAMWIGGMTLTFAVHRKIYDKTVRPGHRYFAKWLIMAFGIFVQASILMGSLYFIGFDKLGIDHWGLIYAGTIVSGLVFMSFIQAIRFSLHDRNLGIFLVIGLLVLQMASGGGLFPVETQSGFYRVLNKIVPMGRTVEIIRELSFDTNWSNVLEDFGYLSIWLFIIPIAVVINHYRTVKIYRDNNFKLPNGIVDHVHNFKRKKKGRS